MEINLSKQNAQEALSRLLSFAKKDDPFAAVYVTDEIILSAYSDSELIEIKCEGSIIEDGLALLPLVELSKLAAKTTSEELKIRLASNLLCITAKGLKCNIPIKDTSLVHSRYKSPPNLVSIDDVIVLRGLISRAKKGLFKNFDNQIYNNIRLLIKSDSITALAVNNQLLAIATYTGNISISDTMEIVIPGRAVDNIYKFLSFIDGPCLIGLDENCLYVENDNFKYKTALAAKDTPDISRILNQKFESRASIDGDIFSKIVDLSLIGVDARNPYIDLNFSLDKLTIKSNGLLDIEQEISYINLILDNPEHIRFNASWLQDVIGKSDITIEFGGANMVKFTHIGDPYEAQYILVKARI